MSEKGGGSKATISTSQISESKAIVDTCDYIVGIVQTEQQKYSKDDSKKGEYRIVVGKNRNGDTGRSDDFEIDWSYMSLKEKIGERK
jgi:replicative DNA helicase